MMLSVCIRIQPVWTFAKEISHLPIFISALILGTSYAMIGSC